MSVYLRIQIIPSDHSPKWLWLPYIHLLQLERLIFVLGKMNSCRLDRSVEKMFLYIPPLWTIAFRSLPSSKTASCVDIQHLFQVEIPVFPSSGKRDNGRLIEGFDGNGGREIRCSVCFIPPRYNAQCSSTALYINSTSFALYPQLSPFYIYIHLLCFFYLYIFGPCYRKMRNKWQVTYSTGWFGKVRTEGCKRAVRHSAHVHHSLHLLDATLFISWTQVSSSTIT